MDISELVIDTKSLSKTYNGVAALDSLNLQVPKNSIFGYLAQAPRFYEHMTGRETLRFKARFYYRGPSAEIEKRITETLELVSLSDKADRPSKASPVGSASA